MSNKTFTIIETGSAQSTLPGKIPRNANDVFAFGVNAVTDNRVRNESGFVSLAPRKIIPNMQGAGTQVSENYPLSESYKDGLIESNTPRQTRGVSAKTLDDGIESFPLSVTLPVPPIFPTPPPETISFPPDPFGAVYPYNSVRETESGHLFEADDTPGFERIKESHRIGTYYEVYPDGTKVTRVVGNEFELTVKDKTVQIQGTCSVTIDGDCNLYTKGNMTQQVDGDYNLWVKGRHNVRVDGDTSSFYSAGDHYEDIKKSKTTKITGDNQHEVYGNEVIVIGSAATALLGLSGNRSIGIMASENRDVRLNSTVTCGANYSIQSSLYSATALLSMTQTAGVFMNIGVGVPVAGSSIFMTPVSIVESTVVLSRSASAVILDQAGIVLIN